ncbi:G-type lectin S-receptor-like serine/threonine-protein kinase At1g11410 [Euphorbia peplus]|nr:G-type lectin S-receptor-like serine/threonine-protein kinase At1g11410 [Euphorbia peplus]
MASPPLLHFYTLLFAIFHLTFSISDDTLTGNQSLFDGQLLISGNRKFALGFFSPGKSRFRYLGIWFHNLPQEVVVWVANRNHPINGSAGALSITPLRNLALYGNSDRDPAIWSADVLSHEWTKEYEVRLLDSGNLVFELIHATESEIVWQSFDYPTNTMLPGMKLGFDLKTGLNSSITSWKSVDDPGDGEFSLRLNASGSPQYFIYRRENVHFWRSVPWPWRGDTSVYNYSFVYKEDEIFYNYSFNDPSVLLRMTLDEGGFIRWFSWHGVDRKWKEFWSAPKYRCDWYGVCGANSKCDPNNVNVFECSCLPGYEPKSERDWHLRDGSSGCVRKWIKSSSVCGNGEGFLRVEHVKIPDTAAAVWLGRHVLNRMECEKECRRNCSCSAYAIIPTAPKRIGCLVWYGELMDVVNLMDNSGYDLYIRVDSLELANTSKGFLQTNGMRIAVVVSVVSAWLIMIVFYLWFWRRKVRTRKNKSNKGMFDSNIGSSCIDNVLKRSRSESELLFFDLSMLHAATNSFSPDNILGQGGFGSVYKGHLPDGQKIAVKRMSRSSRQGIEEFKTEVLLIAKLQHRNLVRLLGCCVKKKEQMLVYEYLPNKSLDSFLFDEERRSILDWKKRLHIIIGIARGMLYLHQDSRLKIIHRDLKSSNILLDAEMNPKISDFGMARIFKYDHVPDKTTRVVGTYGYMSPEYAIFGKYSVKSDVFSFGIILLEIISGKRSNGFNRDDLSLSLIGHVWELWTENRAMDVMDLCLEDLSYKIAEVLRCIQIGLLCVQEDADDRPTMSAVLLMLSSEIALPPPKQPAFTYRTSSNTASTSEAHGSFSVDELSNSTLAT